MNKTIYLSKSMRSNIDVITSVRSTLEKSGYTILEHQGSGKDYNPKLPACADILVMVPPEGHGLNFNHTGVYIGKGQFEDYKNFTTNKQVNQRLNYICVFKKNNINFRYIRSCFIEDKDWQTKFAKLECSKGPGVHFSLEIDSTGQRNFNDEYPLEKSSNQVTDKTKLMLTV